MSEEEKLYWDPERPWGGELVTNVLLEEGVDTVFTLQGGHTISVLNACHDKGIKVVSTRNDGCAVLAAIGYGLSNPGKVGVAVITAGMSAMCIQGILTATWGQVPVVVILGDSQSYGRDMRVLQELDQVPLVKAGYAKEAWHCRDVERIPQYVKWAFRHAVKGIPGCTVVEIPLDVFATRADPAEIEKYPTNRVEARAGGEPRFIREGLEALAEAERPVISVGHLARQSQASEEIKEFVELTSIPVATCGGTLGSSPYNMGMDCPDADVVLLLGKESQGMKGALSQLPYLGSKKIVVYPEAENIGRCYPVEIGIVGDVKVVLQQMIEEAKKIEWPDFSEWRDNLVARREEQKAKIQELENKYWGDKPIHPVRLTKEVLDWMLDNNLHKEAVMTTDGADTGVWWGMFTSAYNVPVEWPGQMASLGMLQRSLGSIGCGPPFAVGAACAHPDRFFLIPAMGDGSLAEYMGELETLARLSVPCVMVVSNNNSFGMVYADQRRIWGASRDQPGAFFLPNLHYEVAAEGLGWAKGEFVEDPDGIRPALDRAYERAKAESKPVMVNVMIDENVYTYPWPWWFLPETPEGDPYEGLGT